MEIKKLTSEDFMQNTPSSMGEFSQRYGLEKTIELYLSSITKLLVKKGVMTDQEISEGLRDEILGEFHKNK